MKWKLPDFVRPRVLRERGVLGINARNHRFIQEHNPRHLYPRVDDKLFTKRLAMEAGVTIPPLYGTVEFHHQIRGFHDRMDAHDAFVVKPARGAGGNGVLVIAGRTGGDYLKTNGKPVTRAHLERHLANILSGLHSLGGHLDHVIVEHRVRSAPPLDALSFQGVPDVRVLVFQGYPVMAMLRLSTSLSDGRANLHQGAIGVGLDIATGRAIHATCHNRILTEHPDTGMPFDDIVLPDWPQLLLLAARCYELTGLGYLGVDLVIDAEKGRWSSS